LPYENSLPDHPKNHCNHHHRRKKMIRDFAKATGEFLKAVLKVMLFGEQPPNDDNHPGKPSH